LRPQQGGATDVLFPLGAKAVSGLRHACRKDSKQHVAIVRLTKRILQRREAFRRQLQRGLDILEAFQRVTQALTSDAKVVQALSIALLQARCKAANFAQPRPHYAPGEFARVFDILEIDSLGFRRYALTVELRPREPPMGSARRIFCARSQLVEKGCGGLQLAGIGAALEQSQDNCCVAGGVGRRGGPLHAA
jgi:hypothetical protein